jgi:hypothetical protein
MSSCEALHALAWSLPRHRFPLDGKAIPPDGVYILFEEGETAHGGERIVRIGTHRRDGQLPGRLREHFLVENKDRSIFRKNVGRALLNRDGDPYLEAWEKDLLSRAGRERWGHLRDVDYQAGIEARVSAHIRQNLSFVTVPAATKAERLWLEERLIGTVSGCDGCGPSEGWLGRWSPVGKIRASGLWQVQGLGKAPLTVAELERLRDAFG